MHMASYSLTIWPLDDLWPQHLINSYLVLPKDHLFYMYVWTELMQKYRNKSKFNKNFHILLKEQQTNRHTDRKSDYHVSARISFRWEKDWWMKTRMYTYGGIHPDSILSDPGACLRSLNPKQLAWWLGHNTGLTGSESPSHRSLSTAKKAGQGGGARSACEKQN